MPPGPMPQAKRRRRNAPVIPTTTLPAGGSDEPAPPCPLKLGKAGAKFWRWAWRTPQAAAWSAGDVQIVARRARLEDERGALDAVDNDDIANMAPDQVELLIRILKGLAAGVLAVEREMTALDDRLGLSPKARQALRWEIKGEDSQPKAQLVSVPDDRWKNAASG